MRRLWLILPLVLSLLFVPPVIAQSKNSNGVKVTSVKVNETINRNYFAANERVEINGTINGDVFVAGGTVEVAGKINGDLMVAGGEVIVSGEISDDARIAGGQVRFSGKVGKNLTVAGGNIDITESATIGKALITLGGNVNVNAPVATTINAAAGTLNINNSVGGDVDAGVGILRLTSKASVNGNVTYWSDDTASIDSQAKISGEITKNKPPVKQWPGFDQEKILGVIATFALVVKIINAISWFIIGLILLKFTPQLFNTSLKSLKEKPWQSIGVGALTIIIVPIVAITLLILVVGIPLSMMLFALFGFALYLAKILVVYFIGDWILVKFGQKPHQVWALILGLVVYGILTMIPVIGGVVGLFATLFGLGAWLIGNQQIYTEARKKNLI